MLHNGQVAQTARTKQHRIRDAILGQIESGKLREGDRLPSESQLAQGFKVSLGTVQKALDSLAQSGLISREHGRGTFVSGSRIDPHGVDYLRFRDQQGNDLQHFIHVKSVRRLSRPGPWREFLGSQPLIRIERNIHVGGKLDLYSEFWLRQAEFQRLQGADSHSLEKNLRLLLGQQLALPTLRVDQWLRFEPPPAAVARALKLAHEQAALLMEIRGYTLRDAPLFYQRVYAPPFSQNLIIVRQ